MKDINSPIVTHEYGYTEINNKPPTSQHGLVINSNEKHKLKYSADQARVFLRFVPFFISEYVDVDDDYHKFLAQLIQICHVVFAPIISNKTIEQLTLMIKEHLRLFKTLFPAENVDPKQHYTLHFPKLIRRNWPLIRSHCFNYESTRNYYKILDRQQNLKNLLLSLAKRHQNLES